MTTQKKLLLALTIIVLLGGLTGYAYFTNKPLLEGVDSQQATSTGSNTNLPEITGIEGLPEGANAEIIGTLNSELFTNTPKPALDRALHQGNLSSEAYTILKNKRAGIVAEINKNPAVMQNWLVLGVVHKQVGDFEGARIYYSYVATVNPENLVAHWNLGTLYENDLHDLTKAEAEFRKVLALDPQYAPAYLELSTMFINAKDWKKAETILLEGIAKLPKDIDLRVAQANYFKLRGDKTQARASYDAAIALAKEQNNSALAASLEADKNAL